jgi:hypothetical protein
MRKPIVLAIVAMLAMSAIAPPAKALLLEGGAFEAHFRDGSALYVPTVGAAAVPRAPLDIDPVADGVGVGPWADTGPQVGDEQRTLFNVDQIIYQSGSTDELAGANAGILTGMMYDLDIKLVTQTVDAIGDTTLTLYFGAMGRNPVALLPDSPAGAGGVIEVWYDPNTPEAGPTSNESTRTDLETLFDPNGTPGSPGTPGGLAPFLWVEGGGPGGRDGYPSINSIAGTPDDSVLWLQGVFAPLGALQDGTPILAIETITFSATSQVVSGNFQLTYIDIVGGAAAGAFEKDGFGPGRDLSIFATLKLPGAPEYAGTPQDFGDWAVRSDDPIEGAFLIPEPATMSLLGLSLLGLVGVRLRKKS